MPTVDERLAELAQVTHSRLDPSPELLERIRTATTHPARKGWARPQLLMAAAAVVAAVPLAWVGLMHGHHSGPEQLAAQPVTRQEFIAAADKWCVGIASSLHDVRVVFLTADGYKAVAGAWIDSTQEVLDKMASAPAPSDFAQVRAEVDADLRATIAQMQTARARAVAGDTTGAQTAIASGRADVAMARGALAAYGATQCGTDQP